MSLPISFSYPYYLLFFLTLPFVFWLWWRGRNPFRRIRDVLSLAVRILVLSLLVCSLAGLQWVRASDELAVVFLLDASDSIDQVARQQAVAFIRTELTHMGPNDRAALVLFGSDALVERPLSQAKELGELLSIPSTAHTDIGEAVRLGLALLPATAQRRLVLLSDGMGNIPGAEMAAQLAAASNVELDAVLLPARSDDTNIETWIDALDTPSLLHQGEEFSVVVRVRSSVAQPALIRLFANDALVQEELVSLNPGLNSFLFSLSAQETGFNTLTVQLVPEKDVFYQNNVLGAFSVVRGAPQVLVVARSPYPDKQSGAMVDDAEALLAALESTGLKTERVTPAYLPADLPALGEYAAVVLVNIPAPDLSPRQMELLQTYVRDLGRGLVCVGGEESYGVGGYFRTPLEETLPVEMTIKDKERMPPLAIVFVVDKSGSMDMAASPGAPRKVELVKEAVIRSLDLLNPGDQIGVVAFEDSAQWVWKLAPLEDTTLIKQQVMTMHGGGGTDIFAGLDAAVSALEESNARVKHVILLTDGGASDVGLRELTLRLKATNGTLSTVGVGQDAAPFLQSLAVDGGGRYHYTDNPGTIPQIFAQETSLAQRSYIVEETFYPALAGRSPILDGIEAAPSLYGYVATSPKSAAQMILSSSQDDPVLAQWQYGLGRAVAWTSDAKGKWASSWVGWEQFPRFWAQAVRWTIVERDETGLETQITDEGERAHIVVDMAEEASQYGNDLGETELRLEANLISPSLEQQKITLRQTAPGRYEAYFLPEEEGVYLVHIAASPAQSGDTAQPDTPALAQTTGFVRSYSPEYRAFGSDETALRRLAQAGQGQLLSDLTIAPAAVFAHNQGAVRTFSDVWPWLLCVAICLVPLDIGVRRVTVNSADLARALRRVWATATAWLRRPHAQRQTPEQRMSRLMEAKKLAASDLERRASVEPAATLPTTPPAASSSAQVSSVAPSTPPAPAASQSKPAEVPKPAPPATTPQTGEMTSRLLAAKKRAGQDK